MNKNTKIIIGIICIFVVVVVAILIGKNLSNKTTKESNANQKETIEEVKNNVVNSINIGDTISSDRINMEIAKSEILPEIKIQISEYSSMDFGIEEGKQAFTLEGKIKNLYKEKIDPSSAIIGKLIIDDNYEYELKFRLASNNSYSLDPLEEKEYYLYAEIPNELVDSYKKAEFKFGYNNDFSYPTLTTYTSFVNGKSTSTKQDKLDVVDNVYSLVVNKQ